MTPEVQVDAQLAARAEKIARARGETVETVVERALREYATEPTENDETRRKSLP